MPHRDGDRAVAVSQRILDEVVEHLAHLVGVYPYLRKIGRNLNLETFCLNTGNHARRHTLVYEVAEVGGYPAQLKATGIDACHIEELSNQPGQSVGIVIDGFEHETSLVLGEPIPLRQQRGGESLDAGER